MSEEESQDGEESRESHKEAVAVIPHNSSSNKFCNKKEKTNGVDSRNVGSKFFFQMSNVVLCLLKRMMQKRKLVMQTREKQQFSKAKCLKV